jgi:hypothetical protein
MLVPSTYQTTTATVNALNILIHAKCVCEWVEEDNLKIIFTPTLENTADIFTKNPTGEIFQKHAVKLVKTINWYVPCPQSQDIIFESQQNEWVMVMHRNNMKTKGEHKSPPSNAIVRAMFDSYDIKTKMHKLPNVKPLEGMQASS